MASGVRARYNRKYKAPRSGIYSCACFAGWMLIGLLECKDELRTESKAFVEFAKRQVERQLFSQAIVPAISSP